MRRILKAPKWTEQAAIRGEIGISNMKARIAISKEQASLPKKDRNWKGNYLEKSLVRIWKRYILFLIDLLIFNNFSSMTFFCATSILRVISRQSTVYNDSLY